MPADSIDWPGIRAAAVTLGIRGAARSAAANLPPDEQNRFVERVMKRASREGWESARIAIVSAPSAIQPAHAKPLSANVRNGAESMADTLADQSKRTRLGLSRYAERMSAAAAETGDLESADNILKVGKIAALAHGWDSGNGASVAVQVNMLVQP